MAGKLCNGDDIRHFLRVDVEGEVLRDLPDEDLAVIRARGDDIIIEGVPVRGPMLATLENDRAVSSGQAWAYQSVSRTAAV